jgi:hypothetical protein
MIDSFQVSKEAKHAAKVSQERKAIPITHKDAAASGHQHLSLPQSTCSQRHRQLSSQVMASEQTLCFLPARRQIPGTQPCLQAATTGSPYALSVQLGMWSGMLLQRPSLGQTKTKMANHAVEGQAGTSQAPRCQHGNLDGQGTSEDTSPTTAEGSTLTETLPLQADRNHSKLCRLGCARQQAEARSRST